MENLSTVFPLTLLSDSEYMELFDSNPGYRRTYMSDDDFSHPGDYECCPWGCEKCEPSWY